MWDAKNWTLSIMKPINMISSFYIPFKMTLWHLAISMLFVLSCVTATHYNSLENNNRLENVNILNNLKGIDTLICRFIDSSMDTIILHKENYTYLSLDIKSSIEECARNKGFKVITDANNIYFTNPIKQKDLFL